MLKKKSKDDRAPDDTRPRGTEKRKKIIIIIHYITHIYIVMRTI